MMLDKRREAAHRGEHTRGSWAARDTEKDTNSTKRSVHSIITAGQYVLSGSSWLNATPGAFRLTLTDTYEWGEEGRGGENIWGHHATRLKGKPCRNLART